MKLYFAPGTCSFAPHLAIIEGNLPVELERVFLRETPRRTQSNRPYLEINPMGAVPALELENGEILTENAVLLQYLAELRPEAKLGPPASGLERWRFLELLNFIATELHKSFSPMFAGPPPEFKAKLQDKVANRLALLEQKLGDKPFLTGDHFTIADAYAYTVMNWAPGFEIKFPPKLQAYFDRISARPSVKQAQQEESL